LEERTGDIKMSHPGSEKNISLEEQIERLETKINTRDDGIIRALDIIQEQYKVRMAEIAIEEFRNGMNRILKLLEEQEKMGVVDLGEARANIKEFLNI
jgi:hypothetical protein